ncbi:MAG TPA: carboxypeptidase-like regulatory domain-containing protein, partial [Halalkalibaculum sp.]|nr:carboxypeptidase-like regulatory domain-containing protein [Halalkalibaculum sp.]
MFQYTNLILLLLLLPLSVLGQDKKDPDRIVIGDATLSELPDFATIKGSITDQDDNPVDGASILVEEKQIGTTSDAKGKYILTMAPGNYTIRFSFLGREPVVKKVALYSNGELNVQLRETSLDMEEIIVEGNQYDDNVGGVITGVENVTIREMEEIPVLLGEVDVVNTLKLLPGVSTVGEGASGFNVRGGRTDQNLVLMNGAHLFNSSHVIGLFSVFNPDIIESFTLFKGHIPARYGGKLSSVLDVNLRDGNFEAFKLQGGIGIAASRLTLEGPIGENTSYLAAGRATYSDWVLGLAKEPDISGSDASFYDTNLQLTHRFNDLNTATVSYYRSYDNFQFSDQFGYSWGSRLFNFNWTSLTGNNFASSLSAVYGTYSSSYFDPSGVESFNLENGIDYLNLKENILYEISPNQSLNAGLEWNFYDGLPETVEPYNGQSSISADEIAKEQGREMAAYISDDITLGELQVSLGLRYSLYQNLGPGQVFIYEPGQPRSTDTIIDTTRFSKGDVIKTYSGFEPRIS